MYPHTFYFTRTDPPVWRFHHALIFLACDRVTTIGNLAWRGRREFALRVLRRLRGGLLITMRTRPAARFADVRRLRLLALRPRFFAQYAASPAGIFPLRFRPFFFFDFFFDISVLFCVGLPRRESASRNRDSKSDPLEDRASLLASPLEYPCCFNARATSDSTADVPRPGFFDIGGTQLSRNEYRCFRARRIMPAALRLKGTRPRARRCFPVSNPG